MSATWNESLATGSENIDRQHRRLFTQVAALENAMKQGKGRQEIAAMLDFLGQYVVQHFREEEELMEELDCPVAAANKQAHTQLLSKFGEIRKRFDDAGAGPSLVLEINTMLSNWLVQHIKGIDVQLREHIGKAKQNLVGAAK